MQVIVYKNDGGDVSIVRPTEESLKLLSISTIAAKDVPTGKPYAIIDASEIPADRSDRAAWTVDEADLTGGVGADYGAGSVNVVTGWTEDGQPILNGGAA